MADRIQRLLLSIALRAGLFVVILAQAGCSGLFFYPSQQTFLTPDRLELSYQNVSVATPDGQTLHGWWLPAEGSRQGTVYYLHGNAQNISSHLLNVAWLPRAGYDVFLIDYRGFGQSTGDPDVPGALTDAESGLRWLVEHHAGSQPLYLLGQSLGAALTVPLAGEWVRRDEQPPLTGVIVDAGFTGFRAIAREKLAGFWLTWPFQIPLSWTIPDDYEPIDYIASISPVPLLIIHSTRDGIVPYHHGRKLFKAAREPKTFLKTDTPHAATFLVPAYRDALIRFMKNADQNRSK